MQYALVENNMVVDVNLPKVGVLKDGSTVSGYDKLSPEILKNEGWLPLLEPDIPDYNPETQYLVDDGYTIEATFVTPKYKVLDIIIDIEQLRTSAIQAMSSECQSRILAGFTSAAFDGVTEKQYDSEMTDQSRIGGLVSIAQLRLSGVSTEPIKWKANGELSCYEWLPESMLFLGLDLKRHIESLTDRFYDLRVWALDSVRTIEELKAWSWGMTL